MGPNRSMPRVSSKWPPSARLGRQQDRATRKHAQKFQICTIGSAHLGHLKQLAFFRNCGMGATHLQQPPLHCIFPPIQRLDLLSVRALLPSSALFQPTRQIPNLEASSDLSRPEDLLLSSSFCSSVGIWNWTRRIATSVRSNAVPPVAVLFLRGLSARILGYLTIGVALALRISGGPMGLVIS